jgi:hypothetical protein
MGTFMDVHEGFFEVTPEQLMEAHQADLDAEGAQGVHFEHAWADPVTGKVWCLSTGPTKEAVQAVHTLAGHPTENIFEITVEA